MRLLQVCLNGDRERSEHPAVPITPAELAVAARASLEAGAQALHLHPRDRDGAESLLAADIGAAVMAVRGSCPQVPVGVSTGLWIAGGDVARRKAWVARWARLEPARRPDFASVNICEPGFTDLVGVLIEAGIGVEAGVWSVPDAYALAELGSGDRWLRILVEIVEGPSRRSPTAGDGIPTEEADEVLSALATSDLSAPVLLHGEQGSCWPCVRHAGRLGLATRIGLEDVTTGPNGGPVRDNSHLVRLAVSEWSAGAHEAQAIR